MRNKKSVVINRFDNFSNSNDVKIDSFYNYLPKKKLLNSFGIETATFPKLKNNLNEESLKISNLNLDSVDGVAYFKQYFPSNQTSVHRILLYGSDKKVYINQMLMNNFSLFWLYELQFENAPITLSYKQNDADAIILADKEKMVVWKTNYSPYTIENVPVITSMCMNEGVLFCTIQEPAFKIWYATDLNAENVGNISNNSGYISLEDDLGYARKIITFNEDVFVIRDYGISKINNVKNNMKVSQVYQSNTKIFANTVSVCGNIVMFMTKEGIYSFNGNKVVKTSVDIKELLTNNLDNSVASSLGNKYYLATKLDFNDDKSILCENNESCVNNSIIIIDIDEFSYQIVRGVDVKSMLPVKTELFEKMLLTFNTAHNDKLGQITEKSSCFGENLPKHWTSGNLVEDVNTKLFTKLSVIADAGVTLNLKYDDKNMEFTTYKNGLNEFNFKICCNTARLEIYSSDASAEVEKVEFEYYAY